MTDNTLSPNEYLPHSVERAQEILNTNKSIEDIVLEEMNYIYGIVHTKTTYILIEKEDSFVLDSRASFLQLHENDFFEDSNGKMINKALFWLKHPKRRTFKGLVFDPGKPGHFIDGKGNQIYNIFKGFAFEATKGDCSLFWNHVKEVICAREEVAYQYVRKWMAAVIQRPRLLATALVLRGQQGTGKTLFVKYFGRLFGPHFLTVNSLDQIVGQFNFHLQNAFLINANEAIWSGNKKEAGALKSLITDTTIVIEGKGKDAFQIDNCRHLIVTSNEECAVPRDLHDRRFYPLDVPPTQKGNQAYFQALEEQMNEEGEAALLYDLLNEDLSDFDPRIMPPNRCGFDMKMKGAATTERYIFEALKAGAWNLSCKEHAWEFSSEIQCKQLFHYYREWCGEEGFRLQGDAELGIALKKLIPSFKKTRPEVEGKRVYQYSFPSLEACRKDFEAFTKEPASIWDD